MDSHGLATCEVRLGPPRVGEHRTPSFLRLETTASNDATMMTLATHFAQPSPVPHSKTDMPGNSHTRPGALMRFQYPLLAAAIALPFSAVYSYPYASNSAMAAGIGAYLSGYARIVGLAVSVIDAHVVVSGNRIVGPMFSMRIEQTCDAMEVTILLVAALAAFPMPLWRRAVAVPACVMFLLLINIVRLCVLYWLGAHAPTWFNRTHETLAPLFLVLCAVGFLLIVTSWAKRGSSGPSV